MAQQIGDLFVKLGFDVDNSKLKSFDESIQSVFNNVLKIAGLGGGAAGLYELAKGAETNAVALRNLNSELGVNLKYAQGFAALWQTVNPLDSSNKGLEITAHMANYLSMMGRGGDSQYGLFGGLPTDSIEQMQEKIRMQYPNVLATHNNDKAWMSQILQTITGSPDFMNVVNATSSQRDAAAKLRDQSDKEINDTVKAAEVIADLKTGWDNFINHAIASLATKTEQLADAASKGGFGGFTDKWNEIIDPYGDSDTSSGKSGIVKDFETAKNFAKSIPAKAIQGKRQQAIDFFVSKGHPQITAEGIVDGLSKENSTFDPGKYNEQGSGAYGIAQWLSKDRVAGFQAHEGRSLYGSTFNQQLDYIEWELRHQERKAGEKLDHAQTRPEAAGIWKNDYERSVPQVSVTSTINVHGTADPDSVAERVHQRFIDTTYATINKGPDF